MTRDTACRLGVDVGGTFTDLVLVTQDGHVVTRKVLSTSGNYAEAIFAGIHDVLEEAGIPGDSVWELIHGTTVATNAIIERRGARTGLVTTDGFGDLLEIGRLRLMRLYDMDQERPAPLVPALALRGAGTARPSRCRNPSPRPEYTRAGGRRHCCREDRIRRRVLHSRLCKPRA